MIRIGVTGQNGFIGSHLKNTIGLSSDEFVLIPFSREYFDLPAMIDEFVSSCDVIVHLAALNRDEDQENLYNQNTKLVDNLIASLIRTEVRPHIVFSSSTQEEKGNSYGKSKRTGRGKFQDWARKYDGKFTGLLIPNVFGPFGKPYYNSFIATFCSQLVSGLEPHIDHDAQVSLIYVGELVEEIMRIVRKKHVEDLYMIKPTASCTVSEVLLKLQSFKEKYFSKGEIPSLPTIFDIQLFNTFRSFIDIQKYFPIKLTQHKDPRGSFVEIIRLGVGGQVSFSTTYSGITRGNHYHTRKIERFAVIRGSALIQLRKIDEKEIYDFYLDGSEPAYVDMPIWYTHNIKNVGDDELYTIFWINEPFDAADPDTYFEVV